MMGHSFFFSIRIHVFFSHMAGDGLWFGHHSDLLHSWRWQSHCEICAEAHGMPDRSGLDLCDLVFEEHVGQKDALWHHLQLVWCLCLCSLHLDYFDSGRSIAMWSQSRWIFVNGFQPRCDLLRDTGTYHHADLVHHWNLVLSTCNNCLGHPHHLQLSRPDCVRRGPEGMGSAPALKDGDIFRYSAPGILLVCKASKHISISLNV